MSRAIREALEAIASPEVSRRVLTRALHMARLQSVPNGGDAFRTFVTSDLRRAVEFALGDESADALLEGLRPILRMADELDEVSRVRAKDLPDSGEHRVARRHLPSLPAINLRNPKVPKAPPPGIAAPIPGAPPSTAPPSSDYWMEEETLDSERRPVQTVLVATLDLDRVNRLASQLTGEASVHLVGDVVELLEALQTLSTPVVVIDCMNPSIQPATIATIAPDLAEGSSVVLWGAAETLFHQVESLADRTRRWLRCGVDATTEDIASLVSMLVA